MIPSLIIIALAFAWLGYESDWLRIRLAIGETDAEYDKRILTAMRIEWEEKQSAYREWLTERYEPALVYGSIEGSKLTNIDPRDQWMIEAEDLTKRRRGEMLYQRGTQCNRW